jgi:septal ring factor EnvC (AmiA/AmiB activator)
MQTTFRLLATFATALLLLRGAAVAQEATGPDVDGTRAALANWAETSRLLSKEKQDWQLGKETLRDRIDLLRREIATMQKRITDAEASIDTTDKKRGELAAEDEHRKVTEKMLQERVQQLERSTLDLLPRLPEPLREQVKPVSQLIPTRPEEVKTRLDERYRNVLYVCKQVHKWNREITLKSEVHTQPNGTSVEVAVMYVGIGQGYYASGDGKVAGAGTATAAGWVWTPNNELATDIALAIAILKNEKVAQFVRLPVQIL